MDSVFPVKNWKTLERVKRLIAERLIKFLLVVFGRIIINVLIIKLLETLQAASYALILKAVIDFFVDSKIRFG